MKPALALGVLAATMLGVAMPGLAAPAGDDAAAIRSARLRYNAAIIGHDAPAIRAVLVDDYTGIAGSDGKVIRGAAAMVGYFAASFRNPAFISFVRSPQTITIADDGERAMESGNWVGRSKRDGGELRLGGEYLAVWVPTHDGWKLRSESFVTLTRTDVEAPPQ